MIQTVDELLNSGVAYHQAGRLTEAQQLYLQVLKQQPTCVDALHNLGVIACQSQQFAAGINYFNQVLEIAPNRVDTHTNLCQALQVVGNIPAAIQHYEKISILTPGRADIHFTLGKLLSQQERRSEAIAHYQKAIDIQPNYIQAYLNLSDALIAQQQLEPAQAYLQKLIEIQPDCADAYWNLCAILRQTHDFALWRQTAERYVQACQHNDAMGAAIAQIQAYYKTGLHAEALQKLEQLESQVYRDADTLSDKNVGRLYFLILFALSRLRDDLSANSKLSKLVGSLYAKTAERTLANLTSTSNNFANDFNLASSDLHYYLRIGFISVNFRRHPVGWCSADVIQALSKLTPFIYLYATSDFVEDDRTLIFEQNVTKCNWRGERWQQRKKSDDFSNLNDLIAEIEQDKLDVLIDLDSLTASRHPEILLRQPARLCASWLGFDAPYISSENYNLGDRHTHPPGIDNYYLETILRLPDAHMAVAGFPSVPIDAKATRKSLKIRDKDIVYLCVTPSIKLNRETVKAHVQILKSVPNSVLLYKGRGDAEVVKSYYELECALQEIEDKRIIFLPLTDTEEEHRGIYEVADILLDSYPYNGGSHTLEALWFNLPVVTRVGEQSFARMGYSFLTTLGITAGISHSWDEYVEWGVGLGQYPALRNSLKEQLVKSKQSQSLAPLWNPRKLAEDMYKLFAEIIAGQRDSDPALFFELGNRLWQEGNMTEAVRRYRQAIALQPDYAEAWGNLGTALHAQDRFDEAIAHYQKSIQLNPANFTIRSNLARAFKAQGNYETAIECYKQVIDLDPGNINPYNRLGEIFQERGELEAAIQYFQQALTIDPQYAFCHGHLGAIYLELNQVERAIPSLQQAIAINPGYSQAQVNLSLALLLKGDLKAGFTRYEWRWQCPDIPNPVPDFSQPLWDGHDFAGKTLLIYAEQGLGDIIQFIRYVPLVRAKGGDRPEILFDCPQSLKRLFGQIKGITLVDSATSLPRFDIRIPLISLPRIFETTLDNIPATRPYLYAPTDSLFDRDEIVRSTTQQLQIGVVWATCSPSQTAQKRSCPLHLFRHLVDFKQAIFYSLQKEIPSKDQELFNSMTWQVVDLRDRLDDFADTAGIIAQMDLVITVDTAVAHLAGAMGMPVWLLLPFAADWRWLLDRKDSPWYPTMRLFRQESIDDWEGAIARVVAALEQFASSESMEK